VYELGGDQAFTMTELAREVSEWAGRTIGYTNLPAEAYVQALVSAGVPKPYAEVLADCDLGVARGELLVTSGDLHRLLGRAPESLKSALRALPRP
jgi:NAD(P)H dehydrogenase (quinone)